MSTTDSEVKAALKTGVEWLEQGRKLCDDLAGVALPKLVDERLPKLSRKELESIVLYQLTRERFGGRLGQE